MKLRPICSKIAAQLKHHQLTAEKYYSFKVGYTLRIQDELALETLYCDQFRATWDTLVPSYAHNLELECSKLCAQLGTGVFQVMRTTLKKKFRISNNRNDAIFV